ncbi:ribonuclease Z [Enterococcus sp. PF1-24]|uniref:ribonuclease Z n=1 Tax=unclassified Enterococcus TaxID=2608891 RepID=UPI0024770533|nr:MULTISPECIES: ribonuclease Z [unclassified Enterococcus]MDH6365463.1 ribonuclease Z [Enterococcus sp. PFB1-1]MDH6402583.1 ribonuclease Z [Enterococcus sp. PF1-24]
MELQFLGTGAGVPAKHRNVSSIALKLLDERNEVWLFDCGEGTQIQILHTNIRPRKINKIFITHLHGDHLFGLPGLLSSRSFQGGKETLELYGPKGLQAFVETSLAVSKTKLSYPLKFTEITEEGLLFEDATFSVYCARLEHGIESFGYRIMEHDHVGELQVDKLQALGVPAGPVYGQLKKGQDVTLADGRQLKSSDFIGMAKKGRIVTILGDTRKSNAAIRLAIGSDALVHESTFEMKQGKMAYNYFHSTSQQAAEVAKEAQVKQLFLTHISARYLAKETKQLAEEAQSTFANAVVVRDFDCFEIPFEN